MSIDCQVSPWEQPVERWLFWNNCGWYMDGPSIEVALPPIPEIGTQLMVIVGLVCIILWINRRKK